MHKSVRINEEYRKKLKEIVQYHNANKIGVDIPDQTARYHTCKSGTRRYPVAVFQCRLCCRHQRLHCLQRDDYVLTVLSAIFLRTYS